MADLQLDLSIRTWVLIPMIVVVMSFTLLRMNLMQLLRPSPQGQSGELRDIVTAQKLRTARLLHSGAVRYITPAGFKARKKYYCTAPAGVLCNPPPDKGLLEQLNMPTAPTPGGKKPKVDATEMILSLAVQWGLQLGIGFFMDAYFAGYFVAKAPFALTYKFKGMFQRGIDVPSLDGCYVSSLSWYMIALFGSYGLVPIINTLRGEDPTLSDVAAITATDPMMNPMAMNPMMGGQNQMGGGQNSAVFAQERDNVELHDHDYALNGIEQRVITFLSE